MLRIISKEFDDGIKIGRAQFDYHISPKKNNHFMFSAGILEEMFSGIGFEYLFLSLIKIMHLVLKFLMSKKRL